MAVTIIDVAKRANVSKSTVSLVINNSPAIKLETKKKVLNAIEELGYVPNINARGLIIKKTNILGVLSMFENASQMSYDFDAEIETFSQDVIRGIPDGLVGTDYGLLNERYCISEYGTDLPTLVKNNRVDGLFIVGSLIKDEFARNLKEHGIPAVVIGRRHELFDYVTADIEQSAFLATHHLIATGHKRLCYVNCPPIFSTSMDRQFGFEQAIQSSEGEVQRHWLLSAEHNHGLGGYRAIKQLWESGARPDGIITVNDGTALGVMQYLYELKVRVPDDISIISCEDSILSGYAVPALSTVNHNKELIGQAACVILLNRIANPRSEQASRVLPTRLVHRHSVLDRR